MEVEIYYSREGETFNDECVEDLDLEIGETYYFGEKQDISPSDLCGDYVYESILERMGEVLYDYVGEHAESAISLTDDAESELTSLIKDWADKHVTIGCYKVVNVKEAVFDGESK